MAVDDIYATASQRAGPDAGHAGEITVQEAWGLLKEDEQARLVDVRTQAEWSYVGKADLSATGREAILAQWLLAPAMSENPDFFNELSAQGLTSDMAAIVMCRTVNRSLKAARAMVANGYPRSYLLLEGFEGSHDEKKHRGLRDGWKAAGLPWTQS